MSTPGSHEPTQPDFAARSPGTSGNGSRARARRARSTGSATSPVSGSMAPTSRTTTRRAALRDACAVTEFTVWT